MASIPRTFDYSKILSDAVKQGKTLSEDEIDSIVYNCINHGTKTAIRLLKQYSETHDITRYVRRGLSSYDTIYSIRGLKPWIKDFLYNNYPEVYEKHWFSGFYLEQHRKRYNELHNKVEPLKLVSNIKNSDFVDKLKLIKLSGPVFHYCCPHVSVRWVFKYLYQYFEYELSKNPYSELYNKNYFDGYINYVNDIDYDDYYDRDK